MKSEIELFLIKCLECGKEISDNEITCPNCGCNPLALMRVRKPDKKDVIYDGDGNELGKLPRDAELD